MSHGSELDLAARRGLAHGIADLLLLGGREFVVLHREFGERGLPGEQDEQQFHALVSSSKPFALIIDGEVLQGVVLGFREGLQELIPLLCTAASASNEQRVEAALPWNMEYP